MATKKSTIWWSVDPFNDDISFHKRELAALLPIAKSLSAVIQPVTYIDTYRALTGEGNIFPLFPLYATNLTQVKELAREKLKAIQTPSSMNLLKETIFLTNNPNEAPSLQQRVESISNAALKAQALFVALRTHSRRGLKRFYMGSFAETFLLCSKVPTLVLRSDTEAPSQWRQAIFPTDFSEESKTALSKLLPIFSKTKTALTLVHVYKDFSSYRFKSSDGIKIFKKHLAQAKKSGTSMLKIARKAKVRAQFKLLEIGANIDTSEALVKLASSSNVDLIAVAAKSSPLKTALAGALTRKQVRNANRPVLVYRSR